MVDGIPNHQNIQAVTWALFATFSQIYSETLQPKEIEWNRFEILQPLQGNCGENECKQMAELLLIKEICIGE